MPARMPALPGLNEGEKLKSAGQLADYSGSQPMFNRRQWRQYTAHTNIFVKNGANLNKMGKKCAEAV